MHTRKHLATRQAKPVAGRRRAARVSAAARCQQAAAVQEMGSDRATGHAVRDRAMLRQWTKRHDCCQVCGIGWGDARWAGLAGLQTHHIIKPGRSDEPCNLLRVCGRCHRIIEGERVPDDHGGHWPRLTLAHVLYSKRERDPQEYDPDRLVLLWRHRARMNGFDPLPEPEPLPEAFLAERPHWRHRA